MEAEFIAASVAEHEYTGGPVEICAVLNRLPKGLLSGPDDQVIDTVDALMNVLYENGRLVCPGHRWLSGPPPTSIRDHLVRLHEHGNVHRDTATGEWRWHDLTSYFAILGRPAGPRAAPTGGRLFRYGHQPPPPAQHGPSAGESPS